MIDADGLAQRLGRFGPDDLPRYAQCGRSRLVVDGAPSSHGFDLVITVSDDDGEPLADELVVRDARGRSCPGRVNRRGQLRFDGVDAPPWRLDVETPAP